MSKFITIETKGFKTVENYFKSLNKNSQAAMNIEVVDFANKVTAEMKRDVPINYSRLEGATDNVVKGLRVEFFSKTDYAAYMEFGTKKKVNVPSWVGSYASQFRGRASGGVDSKKAIEEWAKKKGVNDWKAVWWHIMKNGVKAHPFFFTTKNGQNRIELIKKGYLEALEQGLKNVQR